MTSTTGIKRIRYAKYMEGPCMVYRMSRGHLTISVMVTATELAYGRSVVAQRLSRARGHLRQLALLAGTLLTPEHTA